MTAGVPVQQGLWVKVVVVHEVVGAPAVVLVGQGRQSSESESGWRGIPCLAGPLPLPLGAA